MPTHLCLNLCLSILSSRPLLYTIAFPSPPLCPSLCLCFLFLLEVVQKHGPNAHTELCHYGIGSIEGQPTHSSDAIGTHHTCTTSPSSLSKTPLLHTNPYNPGIDEAPR